MNAYIIHIEPKLEAIQIFINRLMDKIVVNPHNRILLCDEKE
jgi:hypothetical protein